MSQLSVRSAVTAALAISMVAVAGCGSSSGSKSSSASTTAASASATTSQVKYSGPDAKYFTQLASPTKKSGVTLSAGFLDPAGYIPALVAQDKAAGAEVAALGGSFKSYDANGSVQTQVSQFNDLLAQHVKLIMVSPLDPASLAPSIAKAKAQGVVVVQSDDPANVSQPVASGVLTDVGQAFDYSAYSTMAEIAKLSPKTTFGVIGTSSPNPLLKYLIARSVHWGTAEGLSLSGEVDAQSDTSSGWSTAANALLTKYPKTKVIVTYNDPSALAVLSTARSSGHTGVKVVTANGFASSAKQAMKAGGVLVDYAVPYDTMGKEMVIAGYDAISKSSVKIPKVINVRGEVATQANADQVHTVG